MKCIHPPPPKEYIETKTVSIYSLHSTQLGSIVLLYLACITLHCDKTDQILSLLAGV